MKDPFSVIVYLEALYTSQLRRATLSSSLGNSVRRQKVAHNEGALEALRIARELHMSESPLPSITELL